MKYCDECAERLDLDETPRCVFGLCEFCGFRGEVNDRSTSQIPAKPRDLKPEVEELPEKAC
jgi:hypothetical protein